MFASGCHRLQGGLDRIMRTRRNSELYLTDMMYPGRVRCPPRDRSITTSIRRPLYPIAVLAALGMQKLYFLSSNACGYCAAEWKGSNANNSEVVRDGYMSWRTSNFQGVWSTRYRRVPGLAIARSIQYPRMYQLPKIRGDTPDIYTSRYSFMYPTLP